MNDERKIQIPPDLGARLTDWHSSMSDPIYAVASFSMAGCPVPEKVFRAAIQNMERCLHHPAYDDSQQAVMEIVSAMKSVLGESEIRQTIIHAMARYLWSCAWADVMEERGRSIQDELTHLAPETPIQAVSHAERLLQKFEALNKRTIESIVESEQPEDIYDFGVSMAGNFLGYGIDPIGDYEFPWTESCELWDYVEGDSGDE